MDKRNKVRKKQLKVIFLVSLMLLQVSATLLDVVAYELGKVSLAQTTGDYYQQDINANQKLNEIEPVVEQEEVVRKEPVIYEETPLYDQKQEVITKRTADSKTYRLNDGSYVQQIFFEPIHKKVGKKYEEIDNTLENTSKGRSLPIYENKDGLYTFKLENEKMTISSQEQQLGVINEAANLSTYSVKENVILYSEAYPNIDMEYRLGSSSVETNFFINGPTTQKDITFQIEKHGLQVKEVEEALLFVDDKDNVIFTYSKPYIKDAKETVYKNNFNYEDKQDVVEIMVALDENWVNAKERIYPLVYNARASYQPIRADVTSSYVRSNQPFETSQYYDLFVGYESGYVSGTSINIGITRTYMHLANIKTLIGEQKKIEGATLNLHKKVSYSNQWNTIQIGKTSGYVNPATINWNNKPSVTNISTTTIGSEMKEYGFDVTSYVQDLYKGANNTIEIKASNESASFFPNVFLGESSADKRPSITISYRDDWDVDVQLPIDQFDTEMRVFSEFNKGFKAFSFDGIAKPDSQVIFDLVEKDKKESKQTETSKGNSNRYFVSPIYISNPLNNVQSYPKEDINYTTDYIYENRIPQFYVPYEYSMSVKQGATTSTKDLKTDSFIKYKVKTGDNLKSIAAYYGVKIEDLKKDNNLTTNIVKEDDVLLVRFKKDNPKVSKDMYTPPTKEVTYKAKYVDRGANCVAGVCPVIDPVNVASGNYYYEDSDFQVQDGEEFKFIRYYNSTGPQLSNMFGNGFTTSVESYLSYDKDGNMLYFTGDGKIYQFEKTATGFKARDKDLFTITQVGEVTSIVDLKTENTYTFDAYGYLDQIATKDGIVTKITYDEYGMMSAFKVGEKNFTIAYNEYNLVKEIGLPSGKKVTYAYDKNRNLTQFTDAMGSTVRYHYDEHNFLVSIEDKNGNLAMRNTYDADGRVLKQIDGNENESRLVYLKNKTQLIKADGTVEDYTYNEDGDITSIRKDGKLVKQYTYDAYRNITSMEDEEGNITNYSFAKQNLLKVHYPDGTYEEYRYDYNNNVIYQKDKEGNVTNNIYQGNDLISTRDEKLTSTEFEYDSQRRVIKETNQFGATKSYSYNGNMIASITHSNGLIEYFDYDANGLIIKESDNQGFVTTYLYNEHNEMLQKNYTDGSNEKWTYDGNGNIITYQDRIGEITNNTYDKNNNLIASQKGNLVVSKEYNEVNRLTKETNEQGLVTTYEYDVLGNKIKETNAYGKATKYEYDVNGNITKTIDPFDNEEINVYENDNIIKAIGKDGLVTTFEYDELGREIKKVHPNGNVETKHYEGLFLKTETDSKGTITTHFYDAYGRENKTAIQYKDGLVLTSEKRFDQQGNVIETNENGQVTTYTYDVYNRQIATIDALGNTIKKEYDTNGSITSEIDALGNAIKTVYDANQNVVSITDKNGHTQTKTYDINGILIAEKDALGYSKTYTYNKKGQLEKVVDPYQVETTYEYDAYNNLIETNLNDKVIEKKQFDEYGREIYKETLEEKTTTVYDDLDRVIETTNELTGFTLYSVYDEYGNLIETKDSEGLITTFEYDEYKRKIKTVDAYGRSEEVTYNDRDQVLHTKSFDNAKTSSIYDLYGNVIESMDALGKRTTYTYNVIHQLIREESNDKIIEYVYDANAQQIEVKNMNNATSSKTVYDKNGNQIETIDNLGYSTKTLYDAKNQVIAIIDAKGNKSTKEYDANGLVIKESNPLGHSKQSKYNDYGLLIMEVDERGFETKYEYNEDLLVSSIIDSNGNRASSIYDEHKQLIEEINANGASTKYEYDVYGRKLKTIQPNGLEIIQTYDALGNVIKEVKGEKVTEHTYDALGRLVKTSINGVVQTKNNYNKYNQIVKTYDANKNVTTFKYDQNGNIIYTNEKGSIIENEYDVYGNVVKEIKNKTYVTEYKYDALHREIEVIVNDKTTLEKEYDEVGSEYKVIEKGVEVRNEYDANNQRIKIEVPSVKEIGSFVAIQTITYDESGNPIKIVDTNGGVEEKKFDANNNVIEETNRNGYTNAYEYDGLNNLITAQNHKDRYVSYTYDDMNNVIYKNNNGSMSKYQYNLESKLVYEKDEYDYVSKYKYDTIGNKIQEIKPDGKIINYTYDSLGNMLSKNKNTFTYDARNNVVTSTNQNGTIHNTYDVFNNKTTIEDTNGNTLHYVFDQNNRIVEKQYGDTKVSYTYTTYGLLESVHKNDSLLAKYEYNERNELISLTQPTTKTIKTYDDMGRVLSQYSTKNNEVILDAKYTYDANVNVVKEEINGKINTYEYNGYDELEKSSKFVDGKQVHTTYKYDLLGNQIISSSKDGKKLYTYNDKNQVISIETNEGISKITYDDNGNISKKINEDGRIDTYQYDDHDQLIKLQQGQYVYDYSYDAENERVKQVKTDTKDYHYDVWYDYVVDVDVVSDEKMADTFEHLRVQAKKKEANNNVCSAIEQDKYDVTYFKEPEVTTYTIDRNVEYSKVLQANDTTHVYGDTLLQSNEEEIVVGWNESVIAKVTGEKTQKISYNDYGETTNTKQGHSYNGEVLDDNGLLYLRARYYDPSMGRFIQIDQNYAGEKEQVVTQNKYAYTLNNPYKYVDRDGNKSIIDTIKDNLIINLKLYRQMDDKQFGKWIKKQPLTKRFMYTSDRMLSRLFNPGKVVAPSPSVGSNKTSNKGGGSSQVKGKASKQPAKPKCDNKKSSLDKLLDNVQVILDYAGWIPFTIGDIADGLNALISYLRGNILDAVINIACIALPNAVMSGAKALGKTCKSAAEFVSKLSKEARGMVKTIASFITGIRDAIGKVIWLVGEKIIRPIMDKLDKFADKVKSIFSEATEKEAKDKAAKEAVSKGADDVYLFKKYKESLIKGDVLENSRPIIKGVDLKDQTVINTLTKDGSSINDWAKMESVYEYSTDFGSGRIHYYKNLKTGDINYYDAKLKISVPADLKKNLKDPSVVKDGFWIVNVDENFLPTGVRK